MDGVDTRGRAGVAASGAAGRGRSLSRGIRDAVAGAAAATLESVVEADPVTSLVRQSLLALVKPMECAKEGKRLTLPRL